MPMKLFYVKQMLVFLLLLGAGLQPVFGQESIANRHPSWGPDGRIYFQSDRDGDVELYVMTAEGTEQRRLTRVPGEEHPPAFAPDGSRAVFMAKRDADFDLYTMNPDGTGIEPLVVRPGEDWDPVWSPDGRSITWMATVDDGDHELYRIDADGGEARRLTDRPGMDAYPDWDPDGRSLVYIRRDGQNEVFEMQSDGAGLRNLTRNPAEDNGPRISPDGSRIAFFSNRDGNFEIYVMKRDGSEPIRLTHDDGRDFYPTWSPDGEWIAFESDRNGSPEIYRIHPDGTGLTLLTDGRGPANGDSAGGTDAGADAAAHKPKVAILVYDGVQIIDHAAPWEVFGQYSLNDVFTVAKDASPVTTFMGMRVLPSYGFADHPRPDVIVIPGGDAGAVRTDPEVINWIRRNAAISRHVLGVCTGVTLLAEAGLLNGRRVTTFYEQLDDLARSYPGLAVVEDEIVVEDGKYVTTTGTGIEGALRVVELLHGEPWGRVVTLNLELQVLSEDERTPRAQLADMNLPSSIYGLFPWRQAELVSFGGDTDSWTMAWQFDGDDIAGLAASFADGLRGEGWTLEREGQVTDRWASAWSLRGRDGSAWTGDVRLVRLAEARLELQIEVEERAD